MISQYASYNRSVLQLAVPSILANITIPLVGIVDVAILGHISDAAAVGGIAIGTMLFDLLYWNFGFLRVGTSGLTAQAYGRERDRLHPAKGGAVGSVIPTCREPHHRRKNPPSMRPHNS